jgi:hypothetical protein
MNFEVAQALFDQNQSVGVHNVYLPGGWLLNTRRVPVPPVLCRGRERRDEICRCLAILLQDLAFAMDSKWWDMRTYELCQRRRSGLLGDEEYDYDAPADAP